MKTIQYFSDDYLRLARKSSPTQIAKFLDEYRSLHGQAKFKIDQGPTKLISIRLPVKLLAELKGLSRSKGVPYQTLIKQILEGSVSDSKIC